MCSVDGRTSSYVSLVTMSSPSRCTCEKREMLHWPLRQRRNSGFLVKLIKLLKLLTRLTHCTAMDANDNFTLACPCLPVMDVETSTILQGRPFSTTTSPTSTVEHCVWTGSRFTGMSTWSSSRTGDWKFTMGLTSSQTEVTFEYQRTIERAKTG